MEFFLTEHQDAIGTFIFMAGYGVFLILMAIALRLLFKDEEK